MKHEGHPNAPSWFIVEPDDDFLWFNPKDWKPISGHDKNLLVEEEPFDTLDAIYTVYFGDIEK